MYSSRPGLILGFHGCDKSIVKDILTGKKELQSSTNKYDWLGHGIYFWENSPSRALEFVQNLKNQSSRGKHPIKNPAVIGSVLNLGNCLDLTDYKNLKFLKSAYHSLVKIAGTWNLPENKKVGASKDILLRELDCAVIQTLHENLKLNNEKAFDSIRGVFWEGEEVYPNAGFREKDLIQICVINPNCIKGFFLPREENSKFDKV